MGVFRHGGDAVRQFVAERKQPNGQPLGPSLPKTPGDRYKYLDLVFYYVHKCDVMRISGDANRLLCLQIQDCEL